MSVVPRDCGSDATPGSDAVSFEDARRHAARLARPHGRIEDVSPAEARGRVLARDVSAPGPLPPFDQAAMDGYAIRRAGLDPMPLLLPIVGRTDAGDPRGRLMPGTAHRVMTGAAVPEGADTVVMQEHVVRRGNVACIDADLSANTHIRRAGEDVAGGALVLPAGRRLGWPEIGMLAALGIASVPVAAPIRIAILITGNELRSAGTELGVGAVYDANGPMLAALLSAPVTEVTLRRVDDEPIALVDALVAAAVDCDIVITTGGMAFGLKDHVRAAVADAGGRLDVASVAMKPGKPLGLGRIGAACFVGLPGNPQASAFAALAFVRPMVAALASAEVPEPCRARLAFPCTVRPGRTELVPVRLESAGNHVIARRVGPGGSHRMMPMVDADAVAIVPGSTEAGAMAEILPFDNWQGW